MTDVITIKQFAAIDVCADTIIAVADFAEARKPAWKLTIDLGTKLGTKRSSAQVTDLYPRGALIGRQPPALSTCRLDVPARLSRRC